MAKKPTSKQTNRAVALPKSLAGKASASTVYSRTPSGQRIQNNAPDLSQTAIRDLRYAATPSTALRLLARQNGNVGAATFSFVEMAMSGYSVTAYTTGTSQYDPIGTAMAKSLIATLDTVYNYTSGYADVLTVDALIETLLNEATFSSSVGLELVLDKDRLPLRMVAVPYESITLRSRGDGTKYPIQTGQFTGGDEVSLDLATFWMATVHQDLTRTYATPMLEPAVSMAYYYSEFIEDMWRTVKVAGHNRLTISLNSEKIIAAAPPEVREDATKLSAFLEEQRSLVENVVKSLEPEDALITYDAVEAEQLEAKSVKADYTDLLTAISGMLATSLKSHPSILGLRMEGSQSLSNTESLVFLKVAKSIQRPVEDVMGRALTLATRILGADVYVKFDFKPINLRPEDELEAYRTMQQQRILELLSLGMLTDQQAADAMGLPSLPAGYQELSGTRFQDGSGKDTDLSTAVGVAQDPQGRALQPDTPKKAGGESQ